MFIGFKVKNFLSFEKEVNFSLEAGKGRNFNERVYNQKNSKTLKFASLFGANGSGKSNFVKAIAFSQRYILNGNNRAIIQQYYKLNSSCKETPTLFEYKIGVGENVYTYGFEVILSKNQIINEWLICNGRIDTLIFRHERQNNTLILGKYLKNEELKKKLMFFSDSIDANSNSLFLNSVSKYNNLFVEHSEAIVLKNVFNWFANKLKVKFPDSIISDYAYFMSEKNMDDILNFFKDFDLSISNYKFIKCPQEQIALNLPKEVFDDLITSIENELFKDNIEDNKIMFGLGDDFYIAKAVDEQISFETIQFYHEETEIPFHMHEESDGTKKIFKLLEILFQEDDVTYVVDEIDRCLHPLLTYNFVAAFLQKAIFKDCQLIVSTHESLLLDFDLLRKDEMWLVSKENGSTNLESVGDTTIRADKKLIKEYLLGCKGVPKIKDNAYKV